MPVSLVVLVQTFPYHSLASTALVLSFECLLFCCRFISDISLKLPLITQLAGILPALKVLSCGFW
jgi:hypothetical protein